MNYLIIRLVLLWLLALFGCTSQNQATDNRLGNSTDSVQRFTAGKAYIEILSDGTIRYEPARPAPRRT